MKVQEAGVVALTLIGSVIRNQEIQGENVIYSDYILTPMYELF